MLEENITPDETKEVETTNDATTDESESIPVVAEEQPETLQQAAATVSARSATRNGMVAPTIVREEVPLPVQDVGPLPFFNAGTGIVLFILSLAGLAALIFVLHKKSQSTISTAVPASGPAGGFDVLGITSDQPAASITMQQLQQATNLGAYQVPGNPFQPIL